MIDRVSTFMCKTELYHGLGSARLAGKQAARFGIRKALLVTDQGVRQAGLLQSIKDSLQSSQISYEIYDEVREDPDVEILHKGATKTVHS